MSALSSALAAMDKATPGELERYLYQHDVAKPALAWIKEALPWLEKHRENLLLLSEINSEINKGGVNVFTEHLAALDALIARAKPEEVGRC